jgi:hypothetical protein
VTHATSPHHSVCNFKSPIRNVHRRDYWQGRSPCGLSPTPIVEPHEDPNHCEQARKTNQRADGDRQCRESEPTSQRISSHNRNDRHREYHQEPECFPESRPAQWCTPSELAALCIRTVANQLLTGLQPQAASPALNIDSPQLIGRGFVEAVEAADFFEFGEDGFRR